PEARAFAGGRRHSPTSAPRRPPLPPRRRCPATPRRARSGRESTTDQARARAGIRLWPAPSGLPDARLAPIRTSRRRSGKSPALSTSRFSGAFELRCPKTYEDASGRATVFAGAERDGHQFTGDRLAPDGNGTIHQLRKL